MLPPVKGVPIHGEFSSSDAHALSEANARFSLYGANTNGTALSLGTNDVVFITDIEVTAGASALIVKVYDGSTTFNAGQGNLIAIVTVPANDTRVVQLRVAHECVAGTYPKLVTNVSGQVDAVIHGTISGGTGFPQA